MGRPRKYLPGPPVKSLDAMARACRSGLHLYDKRTNKPVHPAWALSWQFRMAMQMIHAGRLLYARKNPDHPDFKTEEAQ